MGFLLLSLKVTVEAPVFSSIPLAESSSRMCWSFLLVKHNRTGHFFSLLFSQGGEAWSG